MPVIKARVIRSADYADYCRLKTNQESGSRETRKQETPETNLEARKPGIVGQAPRLQNETLASEALALQIRSDFIRSRLEARIRETEVERFYSWVPGSQIPFSLGFKQSA
jgi:hypothetical protein